MDKVKQEVAGLRSDIRFDFKLNNEMMSFLVINGFFFTVLLFIQLIWFFITSYSTFVGWWAFASAAGLFYFFLRPTSDEKQNVQGYFENFDSSVLWHPKNVYKPTSVAEIASLVKESASNGKKIRVYGGGSAFNAIGQTRHNVILLDNFKSVQVNDKNVTVGAGLTIGELAVALYENHLSIPSLGWFDAQSVGSAISTTSHANSLKHGSLASRVVALELVNGNGEVVTASESENEDVFNAARGGLGLLGVITSVTFSCDATTNLKKTASIVSLDEASSDLSGRASSNEYYTIWWIPHINKANLVILNKTSERTAAEKQGNVPVSPVAQYQTLAVSFAHKFLFTIYYKVLFTASAFVEIVNSTFLGFFASSLKPQDSIVTLKDGLLDPFVSLLPRWSETEYFVPVENAQAAFKDLQQSVRTGGWVVNFPVRIGFVKGDSHWLSENYNTDSVTFSLAMFSKAKWNSFSQKVDKIMKNYGGRPHWAKTHGLNKQELEQLYPKWNDFSEVRKRFDPQGVFLNDYLEKIFA